MLGSTRTIIALLPFFGVALASESLWFESDFAFDDETPRLRKGNGIGDRQLYSSIAAQNCIADARRNEDALKDIGLKCKCVVKDVGVVLVCIDDCSYCNDKKNVCGIQAAQGLYDSQTGQRKAIGGLFQYLTRFRDTTIAVENDGCSEENGQATRCQSCNIYVNGQPCQSCVLVDCPNGGQAELANCENIEIGASFHFCEAMSINEYSVFTAMSTYEFKQCLPLDKFIRKPTESSSSTSKKSKKSGSYSNYDRGYVNENTFGGDYGGDRYSSSPKRAKKRRQRALI